MCITQTSENAKVTHIRFEAIPFGIRGISMQCAAGHTIKHVDSRVNRLTPELKRHRKMMKHAAGTFHHCSVVTLNNRVLLRCVGSGEFMPNAFMLNEILKIFGQEFTPVVSPQFSHRMTCLFLRQLVETHEFAENFGAVSHEENESEAAVIIFKCYKVRMATMRDDLERP